MPKRARSASGGASAEAAGPVTVDLCLSSDEDEDNDPSKARATQPARRSSRLEERERPHDAQKLICFPPSGSAKETITLTYGDLRRLRPSDGTAQAFIPTDQLLLNDQLVDFYVKYLLQPLPEQPPTCKQLLPGLSDKSRERVHIFNAFFLKRLRLTINKGRDLDAMLKWTKDVDLFEKDFLFVPVHEVQRSGHWALAVVCFPRLVIERNGAETNAAPPSVGVPCVKEEMVEEKAGGTTVDAAMNPPSEGLSLPAPPPPPPLPPPPPDPPSPSEEAVLASCRSGENSPVRASLSQTASGETAQEECKLAANDVASTSADADAPPPAATRAPCILFLDSFLTNETKMLFSQLRTFLEFYWRRKYADQACGYGPPGAGAGVPPPPPTEEYGWPGPKPATKPPRAKRGSRTSGGSASAGAASAEGTASAAGARAGGPRVSTRRSSAAAELSEPDRAAIAAADEDLNGVHGRRRSRRSRGASGDGADIGDSAGDVDGDGRGGARRKRAAHETARRSEAIATGNGMQQAEVEEIEDVPQGSLALAASAAALHVLDVVGKADAACKDVAPDADAEDRFSVSDGRTDGGVEDEEQPVADARASSHDADEVEASQLPEHAEEEEEEVEDDVDDPEEEEEEEEGVKADADAKVDAPTLGAAAEKLTTSGTLCEAGGPIATGADAARSAQGVGVGDHGGGSSAGGAIADAVSAGGVISSGDGGGRPKPAGGKIAPAWFTPARMPHVVLKQVPQQQNDYDCGVYMLHFVERLSSMVAPSFESVDGLTAAYGKQLFGSKEIDDKRDKLHRLITALARSADVSVFKDDDDSDDDD